MKYFLILSILLYLLSSLLFPFSLSKVGSLLLTLGFTSFLLGFTFGKKLGDLYSTLALIGNLSVLTYLIFYYRFKGRGGEFGLIVSLLGLLGAILSIPARGSKFKDPLFALHLLSASTFYSLILLSGIASLLKTTFERRLKRREMVKGHTPISILRSIETYSIGGIFFFSTLTLVFGSLWSLSYYGSIPLERKTLVTFFLWLYYGILFELVIRRKVKPSSLSKFSLLGFLLSLLSLAFLRHKIP